jgi:hypothetical protein
MNRPWLMLYFAIGLSIVLACGCEDKNIPRIHEARTLVTKAINEATSVDL